MSEGEFKKRLFEVWEKTEIVGEGIQAIVKNNPLTATERILDEARKDIFEAIDKHIEELVTFWQSKPDPQKQKVAEYYIDAYHCIQHNIKKEDSFKLLKWFGNVEK